MQKELTKTLYIYQYFNISVYSFKLNLKIPAYKKFYFYFPKISQGLELF